jgi:hypothetical protein
MKKTKLSLHLDNYIRHIIAIISHAGIIHVQSFLTALDTLTPWKMKWTSTFGFFQMDSSRRIGKNQEASANRWMDTAEISKGFVNFPLLCHHTQAFSFAPPRHRNEDSLDLINNSLCK